MIGDALVLLAGGGLFGAGTVTGAVLRPRRRTPAPSGPALACSCGHTPGAHDTQAGQCRAEVRREHDGPEPLASFTARGLALPPS